MWLCAHVNECLGLCAYVCDCTEFIRMCGGMCVFAYSYALMSVLHMSGLNHHVCARVQTMCASDHGHVCICAFVCLCSHLVMHRCIFAEYNCLCMIH